MADSEHDEDLERAIALSLQDAESANEVVDLTTEDDDEDDDDLQRALALSLQGADPLTPPSSHPLDKLKGLPKYAPPATAEADVPPRETLTTEPTAATTKPYSLAGMDRKAMEQERLARLGKRKRSASPARPSKVIVKTPSEPHTSADASATVGSNTTAGLQFTRGVLRRTWAHKHPRSNDIKVEEVFQASDLKLAIMSSFQWDTKWVLSKVNPNKIKQVWFMSAKEEWLREKMLKELEESGIQNLRPRFPPLNGQAVNMHSKFMLLVHEEYLRVAIPTANMIHVDWGETNVDGKGESWQPAVMENSVFLIDLPQRPDRQPAQKAETAFGQELVEFLRAQEASRNVVDGVLKFDFKDTDHLAFVHSL